MLYVESQSMPEAALKEYIEDGELAQEEIWYLYLQQSKINILFYTCFVNTENLTCEY